MYRILYTLLCFMLLPLWSSEDSAPRLLISIPTHGHPTAFFATLDQYYLNLSKEVPYQFVVACDLNDSTMNKPEIRKRLGEYPHLTVIFSNYKSQPEAYNASVDKFVGRFDILLVANEDFAPADRDYDKKIVAAMQEHFPDYDGVVNFRGESSTSVYSTPVMGKAFYQRFGYVYQPAYQADYYDQELTCVSRILGKEADTHAPLLKRQPTVYTSSQPQIAGDKEIFLRRRANTFDLDDALLASLFPKDWSILICTPDKRDEASSKLYKKLTDQIKARHLEDRIEILFFKGDPDNSVGYKRNELLRRCRGMYVNFIDDDDDIHNNYIGMIHDALKSRPDCVSLLGIITFDGAHPASFLHSIKYQSYFQQNGVYFRPPNHINTIKRAVASQFLFPNISYGEDTDWAMQITRSGLLKKEEPINVSYYFYKYVTKK